MIMLQECGGYPKKSAKYTKGLIYYINSVKLPSIIV